MRGLGIDVVYLPDFVSQVGTPGSAFLSGFLSPREERRVRARASASCSAPPSSPAYMEALGRHAGGMWAAKEAFIKAWSSALYAVPPPLPEFGFNWHSIEILHDAWDRPALALSGDVCAAFEDSVAPLSEVGLFVSISHDGPTAFAQVVID